MRFGWKLAMFAMACAFTLAVQAQPAPSSGSAEQAKALGDRGNAAYDAGRYQQALAFYNNALNLAPDDEMLLLRRGSTYVKLERCAEALPDLDRGADIFSFDEYSLYLLGILSDRAYCLIELEKYELAIADLELHLKYETEDVWALTALGRTYGLLNDFGKSEAALKRAIAVQPDDSYANFQMALVYLMQKRANEAVPYLQNAVRLDPADRQAAELLASVQADLAASRPAAPAKAPVAGGPSFADLYAKCRSDDGPMAEKAQICFTLAGYRTSGVGAERNRAEAHWLYARACRFGIARSCLLTGALLDLGHLDDRGILPPNHESAVFYYNLACNRDSTLCGDAAIRSAIGAIKEADPD